MLSYDDGDDRIVVQEWFLEQQNIQLTEGSKYEVDLLGEDFDVEISHLSFPNLWNQWQP